MSSKLHVSTVFSQKKKEITMARAQMKLYLFISLHSMQQANKTSECMRSSFIFAVSQIQLTLEYM